MTDRSTAETVAIIGAGIGGLYLIAELGVAGFKLRLHDIDDSKLSEIRARGGVDVEGERGGFAAVERATSDLRNRCRWRQCHHRCDRRQYAGDGGAIACASAPEWSGNPLDPGQHRRVAACTPCSG